MIPIRIHFQWDLLKRLKNPIDFYEDFHSYHDSEWSIHEEYDQYHEDIFMIPIHYHSFINFPWIGQALPRCFWGNLNLILVIALSQAPIVGPDPWDFLEDHPISRVGIDVPTFGDLFHITFPYQLEMESPLFSWVKWNITGHLMTFTNPCIWWFLDMTGSPQSSPMVVHGIFPKTNHFKWYPHDELEIPIFFDGTTEYGDLFSADLSS